MSTRLWFRLDEVLPLAEHAMVCDRWSLSIAHLLTRAPLGPALVWTSPTLEADVLRSNGLPGWYDEHGDLHTVTAHTWRHVTGRRGVAATAAYRDGYLPLDGEPGQPSLLEVLRAGRHTCHWVTVDVDPADEHLIGPDAVRLVNHRDQIAPADAVWLPRLVTARAVAGHTYPALVAHGYPTGDGHVLARFDQATVERMVADLEAVHANPDRHSDAMPGEYPTLLLDGDVVVLLEEDDDPPRLVEVDRAYPDADGRYSVGAYLWDWQIAPDQTRHRQPAADPSADRWPPPVHRPAPEHHRAA